MGELSCSNGLGNLLAAAAGFDHRAATGSLTTRSRTPPTSSPQVRTIPNGPRHSSLHTPQGLNPSAQRSRYRAIRRPANAGKCSPALSTGAGVVLMVMVLGIRSAASLAAAVLPSSQIYLPAVTIPRVQRFSAGAISGPQCLTSAQMQSARCQ